MNLQRITGSVLVIGSVIVFIAAFSPIAQVFSEPDAAKKLEIITNGGSAWGIDQILFALGAIVTAAGVALIAYQLRNLPGSWWAYLGVAAVVIGAAFWSWDVYQRGMDPQGFVDKTLAAWPFIVYTLLTQAGLAAVGIVLLRSALPGWVGWVLTGGSLIFFVVYLIFKDMPPFAYYILTLPAGIMMLWKGQVSLAKK